MQCGVIQPTVLLVRLPPRFLWGPAQCSHSHPTDPLPVLGSSQLRGANHHTKRVSGCLHSPACIPPPFVGSGERGPCPPANITIKHIGGVDPPGLCLSAWIAFVPRRLDMMLTSRKKMPLGCPLCYIWIWSFNH